jgi:murein DD-endopeptidase MepM/ murein hydrolase activator NlpD
MMSRAVAGVVAAAVLVVSVAVAGEKVPWRRRIGREVTTYHLSAHKKTPPDLWPIEPESPADLDGSRFADSLGRLCGRMPAERRARYSAAVLDEAARFDVDPFLLAALLYDQSRCWPRTPRRDQEVGRYGLTRIPVTMHQPHVRKGRYVFFLGGAGEWREQSLAVDLYPFNKWQAAKVEPNLYFAAAILQVLERQAASLDARFPGVSHRHFVSHWFYGDRVREVEPENRVLTARRRLIEYYRDAKPALLGTLGENEIFSPLDGVPRLVIDYFGNPRGKKGTTGHRGIDIDGAAGEPVRAIAAGRVTFAGVDLPGAQAHELLEPKEANELDSSEMGPGGLYVAINHGGGYGSVYMHLESIAVAHWDEVAAGQVIGALGRSGTVKSGPHLHLEIRSGTQRIDPAVPLARALVDPYR